MGLEMVCLMVVVFHEVCCISWLYRTSERLDIDVL